MHFGWFLLYTTLGAGVWNCILAALGWYLHAIVPEDQLNDKIMEYGDYIKYAIIGLVLIGVAYAALRHYMKKKK